MLTDLVLVVVGLACIAVSIVLYTRNPALELEVRTLRRDIRKMRSAMLNLYDAAVSRRDVDPISADYAQTAEALFGTEFLENRDRKEIA